MNISIQLKRDEYNIFTEFCSKESITQDTYRADEIDRDNIAVTSELLLFQLFYDYAVNNIQSDKWSWCKVDRENAKEIFSYKWELYEDLIARLTHIDGVGTTN